MELIDLLAKIDFSKSSVSIFDNSAPSSCIADCEGEGNIDWLVELTPPVAKAQVVDVWADMTCNQQCWVCIKIDYKKV